MTSCYLQAGYVGEDVESILYKLLTVTSLKPSVSLLWTLFFYIYIVKEGLIIIEFDELLFYDSYPNIWVCYYVLYFLFVFVVSLLIVLSLASSYPSFES